MKIQIVKNMFSDKGTAILNNMRTSFTIEKENDNYIAYDGIKVIGTFKNLSDAKKLLKNKVNEHYGN